MRIVMRRAGGSRLSDFGAVRFEYVAFLKVLEPFKDNPAFEASGDLSHVILEVFQTRDLSLEEALVVSQHMDVGAARYAALVHIDSRGPVTATDAEGGPDRGKPFHHVSGDGL